MEGTIFHKNLYAKQTLTVKNKLLLNSVPTAFCAQLCKNSMALWGKTKCYIHTVKYYVTQLHKLIFTTSAVQERNFRKCQRRNGVKIFLTIFVPTATTHHAHLLWILPCIVVLLSRGTGASLGQRESLSANLQELLLDRARLLLSSCWSSTPGWSCWSPQPSSLINVQDLLTHNVHSCRGFA